MLPEMFHSIFDDLTLRLRLNHNLSTRVGSEALFPCPIRHRDHTCHGTVDFDRALSTLVETLRIAGNTDWSGVEELGIELGSVFYDGKCETLDHLESCCRESAAHMARFIVKWRQEHTHTSEGRHAGLLQLQARHLQVQIAFAESETQCKRLRRAQGLTEDDRAKYEESIGLSADQLDAAQELITQLRRDLEHEIALKKGIEADVWVLRTDKQELQAELDRRATANDTLTARIAELEHKETDLQQALAASASTLEDSHTQAELQRLALYDVKAVLAARELELESSRSERENLRKQLKSARVQNTASKGLISLMTADLDRRRFARDVYDARARELEKRVAGLEWFWDAPFSTCELLPASQQEVHRPVNGVSAVAVEGGEGRGCVVF